MTRRLERKLADMEKLHQDLLEREKKLMERNVESDKIRREALAMFEKATEPTAGPSGITPAELAAAEARSKEAPATTSTSHGAKKAKKSHRSATMTFVAKLQTKLAEAGKDSTEIDKYIKDTLAETDEPATGSSHRKRKHSSSSTSSAVSSVSEGSSSSDDSTSRSEKNKKKREKREKRRDCLLYTSPSPRDS